MNPEINNIHAFIYRQHGREVLSGLRKLEKVVTKLEAWQNHRHFNIRCVHSNVMLTSNQYMTEFKCERDFGREGSKKDREEMFRY